MTFRRHVLNGLGAVALTTCAYAFGAYRATLAGAEARITVPTLILSSADDLFGTADTARLLARHIRDAQMIVYPEGGHIWLGHDAALIRAIRDFIMGTARP